MGPGHVYLVIGSLSVLKEKISAERRVIENVF